MKNIGLPLIIFVAGVLMFGASVGVAGEYPINVSIVAENLYETSDGTEIKTQKCKYQANEEDAILDYKEGRRKNSILFDDRKVRCAVAGVMAH